MSGAKSKTSQKSSSKPVADSSDISQNQDEKFFKNDAEEEKFLEWFWKGSNGNNLVRKLNGYAQRNDKDDRIRREKESPVVYAVVLNAEKFSFKEGGKLWKLCKVGFTHRSIKKGTGNRMEHVCKQIEKELPGAKANILFAMPIGAVDTTPFSQTESRIREKVGKPVDKDKAKKDLGLPVPTEWVLTTQEHIDTIKEIMEKKKEKEKEKEKTSDVDESGDLIDTFKSRFKITPEPPEKFKEWCTK